jgi:uncharacterized membrane protein
MNIFTVISSMFYMLTMVLLYVTFSNVQATGAPAALVLACLATLGGAYFTTCSMEKHYGNQ